MQVSKREWDKDLVYWLAQLGQTDRERYREIREAMWAMFADNFEKLVDRSDIPSKMS